jgi:N-acetylglucosaminyldiphosphoundecaprenol N-acetyl-beta-D-mannosaminyltransferase
MAVDATRIGVLAAPEAEALRCEVLGCRLDAVTLDDAVARVQSGIETGRPVRHMAMNAAKLLRLQDDRVLREAARACDLVTADGQAVVWAARLLGQPLPERVTGIDLMGALLGLAGRRGHRVFLLGAREDVVEDAARLVRERFPGVGEVSYHHGYFAAAEEERVLAEIERAAPQLLFLALETPAKEYLLGRLAARVEIPFAMGVGGALDVLTGRKRRAPRFLQAAGLEWLYRFAQDPRRLARRYLVGNPAFCWLVLREVVRKW